MASLRYFFILSATMLCSCGDSITPRGIKGTWKVTSVTTVSVTNYATYKNDPNFNFNGEGYKVTTTDVSGEWLFTEEEANINYSYRYTEPINDQPIEESYSLSGLLVMDGRQKFFSVDSDLDYELFDIHERKGKKMTVVYENLYLIDYGTLVFIDMEKQ